MAVSIHLAAGWNNISVARHAQRMDVGFWSSVRRTAELVMVLQL